VTSAGVTDALVIGAGVAGLTTAICLAEAGLQVVIKAAEPPGRTTSAVAGAIWGPHLVEDSDRVAEWCADTLGTLTGLAGRPGAGVRLASGVMATHSADPGPDLPAEVAAMGAMGAGIQPCAAADLPAGFAAGWRYSAPVVSMPVYLDYLLGRFRQAGGELRIGRVASLAEAAASTAAQVIVNCTGTAAHDLVPDPAVIPYRGQVVVAENPGLTEFFIGQTDDGEHEMVYVFPHDGRVVLGGTEVAGDWSAEPDPGTARRILRDCAAVDPRLAGARIIEHRVGFRPARPQVRLEAEDAVAADGHSQRLLVHNYGHGGAGVTLSWGCARAVAGLVAQLA
jgi:D-amino-acid oxidase